MSEIKCPHCGQAFTIDESEYSSLMAQIRDHVFQEEVERRLQSERELVETKTQAKYKELLSEKENELTKLKAEAKQEKNNKDNEIALAITKATKDLETKIQQLETESLKKDNEAQLKLTELNNKLENADNKNKMEQANLKQNYEFQLKGMQEQLDLYKDFKLKLSTKAIGESLEQYCHDEFNKLRATAFPNAYFEKDNEVSKTSGSKGDFIFKDFKDGVEYVSIMFEMKNESGETKTKHKNADFFKELDKDRNEKGCEYAVLVSMLEEDSELYNQGIVNVSHRYPKMYVVRPQFFIPIITLIRDGALNSVEAKKELMKMKNQDIDLSNFESNMNKFKEQFGKNYVAANKKFNSAIEEIDKSITHLQKIKDDLISSDRQLRLANDKAQDLTIKKLTKNAPSIKEKLDQLHKEDTDA